MFDTASFGTPLRPFAHCFKYIHMLEYVSLCVCVSVCVYLFMYVNVYAKQLFMALNIEKWCLRENKYFGGV